MAEWDPDRMLEGLATEMTQLEGTEEEMAIRIFKEGLVPSAAAICHMAVQSTNERTRLTAAQYVVERNLGRLNDRPPLGRDDPFDALAKSLAEEGQK